MPKRNHSILEQGFPISFQTLPWTAAGVFSVSVHLPILHISCKVNMQCSVTGFFHFTECFQR